MTTSIQKYSIDGFKALVFRMQDILLAADLEQIDELIEMENCNQAEEDIVRLDRLIFSRKTPFVYKDPHVITIQYQETRVAVQIDHPEDITFVTIEAIRSFPPIVEKLRQQSWLWGIGLLKEEPALLIDCHKLAAACFSEQEPACN